MDDARFWELIGLLGGVPDERSVRALEADLRPDEVDRFDDALGGLIDRLLERREVPESHQGDTAEWIAAAVVAAGRPTYERELAAHGPLDPDDWAWSDAEVLLVAGFEDDGDGDEDEDEAGGDLGVWLQWKAPHPPPGVTTSWDAETEADLDDPETGVGDDPAYGRVVTADPAWAEALATLAADPEFHRRRGLMSGLGLHVVVRDVEEWTLTPWPSDELVDDVVLTVPAAQARDADPRAEFYLEAVVALITSAQENLGLGD